jgi:hypothetical protein
MNVERAEPRGRQAKQVGGRGSPRRTRVLRGKGPRRASLLRCSNVGLGSIAAYAVAAGTHPNDRSAPQADPYITRGRSGQRAAHWSLMSIEAGRSVTFRHAVRERRQARRNEALRVQAANGDRHGGYAREARLLIALTAMLAVTLATVRTTSGKLSTSAGPGPREGSRPHRGPHTSWSLRGSPFDASGRRRRALRSLGPSATQIK